MRSANVVRPNLPDDSSQGEQPPTTPVLAANDKIEVIEWDKRQVSKETTPANSAGGSTRSTGSGGRPSVSTKRIEVEIDAARVTQIQQALAARGFLGSEPTGVYDEGTIEAMRQFQMSQKIDVTGYPTAQALKKLGL